MHGRKPRLMVAVAGVLILGGVAAVVAQAAQVRVIITPNGPGEGEGLYNVSGGRIRPVQGRITAPSTFKCNTSNLIVKASSIALTGGKLNFTGKAYVDKFRKPSLLGTLTWKGTPTKGTIRFVSPKTLRFVRGRVTVVNRKCDTGTLRYKLRPGP